GVPSDFPLRHSAYPGNASRYLGVVRPATRYSTGKLTLNARRLDGGVGALVSGDLGGSRERVGAVQESPRLRHDVLHGQAVAREEVRAAARLGELILDPYPSQPAGGAVLG